MSKLGLDRRKFILSTKKKVNPRKRMFVDDNQLIHAGNSGQGENDSNQTENPDIKSLIKKYSDECPFKTKRHIILEEIKDLRYCNDGMCHVCRKKMKNTNLYNYLVGFKESKKQTAEEIFQELDKMYISPLAKGRIEYLRRKYLGGKHE